MDLLKLAFIIPPALVSLDYSKRACKIIFAIDASLKKWKRVIIQLVQGKRYSSRYESGIWSIIEKKYNATK